MSGVFVSGNHEIMHNVYIWYPWYAIFMSGSRLWFYVLYIPSFKFFTYNISNYWSNGNIDRLVTVTSRNWWHACTTRLCPTPWLEWTPCLIGSQSVKNVGSYAITHTHRDRHTHEMKWKIKRDFFYFNRYDCYYHMIQSKNYINNNNNNINNNNFISPSWA